MQANRSRDTGPELLVRKALHALGLRYRVAVRPVADIRIAADIVFRGPRVAVFIDGCFWHGCPAHSSPPRTNADYWAAKIAANRERDARAGRLLGNAGWTVIRVWEHEDPRGRGGEDQRRPWDRAGRVAGLGERAINQACQAVVVASRSTSSPNR